MSRSERSTTNGLLPIVMTDPNQVTAIIPYRIEVNTQQQLLLQRGDTLSLPVPVNISAASPSVVTTAGGQAMILDSRGSLLASNNPARSGDVVTLYCIGLGELQEPATAGNSGSASSATVIPVAVTIGGLPAAVSYSGLAPSPLIGVYVVRVTVPNGVAAGDRVPVILSALGKPVATAATVFTFVSN